MNAAARPTRARCSIVARTASGRSGGREHGHDHGSACPHSSAGRRRAASRRCRSGRVVWSVIVARSSAALLLATPGLAADKGTGVPRFCLFGRVDGFLPDGTLIFGLWEGSGLVPDIDDVQWVFVQPTEDTECYIGTPSGQPRPCSFSTSWWYLVYGTVSGGDFFAERVVEYPQRPF